MHDRVDTAEIRKLATLARLSVEQHEVEPLREQIAAILDHLRTIAEVDVEGVEPQSHPMSSVNRLDDDVVRAYSDSAALLDAAPLRQGPFVGVPKVIGDSTDS